MKIVNFSTTSNTFDFKGQNMASMALHIPINLLLERIAYNGQEQRFQSYNGRAQHFQSYNGQEQHFQSYNRDRKILLLTSM